MFQIVGKIVHNNRIVGLMVYNFANKQLLRANLKDCIDEVSRNNITNLSYENKQLNVTDGSISKLPVYDINGTVSVRNLPVILERVTNNGITVGYTFIKNGVYNKAKTADLIKTYREFYNAKVVTKDGNTFLSAKRGTFKELKLDELKEKSIISVPVVQERKRSTEIVYDKNKFDIKHIDNDIVLIRYKGDEENVVIPNGVTKIGKEAFRACKSLKSVAIPNSVTEIGKYVFAFCKSLKSIAIPNSVTKIGRNTFEYCTSLESVTIPNSVTKIGHDVFRDCGSLKSVAVPNSVTEIKNSAFAFCSLESIKIPDSVKVIDEMAFYGNTDIEIPKRNDCHLKSESREELLRKYSHVPDFDSFVCNPDDYDIDGYGYVTGYRGTAKKIRLPEGVRGLTVIPTAESYILPTSFTPDIYWDDLTGLSGEFYVAKDNDTFSSVNGCLLADGVLIRTPNNASKIEITSAIDEIACDVQEHCDIIKVIHIHHFDFVTDGCADLTPEKLIIDDDIDPSSYYFSADNNGGLSFGLSWVKELQLYKTGKPPKCKMIDGNIVSIDGKELVLAPVAKQNTLGI